LEFATENGKYNLPDFLIVGAMKAGTTTLMHHLYDHPEISIPRQEVYYFSHDENFNQGPSWYGKYFDSNKDYRVFGEKTPTYSYLDFVPERVYSLNKGMKLIWMFREPSKRAYSNYVHAMMKGVETNSFEYAINNEAERIEKSIFFGYKERSKYVNQVEAYLKYFPLSQMHFIIFENFIQNEEQELKRLYDFLGVGTYTFDFQNAGLVANESYIPFSPKVEHFNLRKIHFKPLKKVITYVNRELGHKPLGMSSEVKGELKEYFKPYNSELSGLTDLDLSSWD